MDNIPVGNMGSNTDKGFYSKNYDVARKTVKQTTLSGYNGSAAKENGLYTKIHGDTARKTIKQTTLSSYEGPAGNIVSTYINNGDKARKTIRETTSSSYEGGAKSFLNNQSSQDMARNMTIDDRREITNYNRPSNGGGDIMGPEKSVFGKYQNTKKAGILKEFCLVNIH